MQPIMERINSIEIDRLQAAGEFNYDEFNSFFQQQYNWQIASPFVIGLGCGALFGVIHSYTRKFRLEPTKEVPIIAGMTYFVLYVVPTLKYPADPLSMNSSLWFFSPYQIIFAEYAALSGLVAIAVAFGSEKINNENKVFAGGALFLVAISVAHLCFPPDPTDLSYLPPAFLSDYRAASVLIMTAFWLVLTVATTLMWKKYLQLEMAL